VAGDVGLGHCVTLGLGMRHVHRYMRCLSQIYEVSLMFTDFAVGVNMK
jgi:hypothetical protein